MRRILLVALLALAGATTLAAQRPDCPRDSAAGAGMMRGMKPGGGGGMDHAMMMRMDSLGARLDSLTKVMNRASGSRKVDAMAAVLTTLVSDHREMQRHMHERMMREHGMGGGGMAGGMEHGAMGAGPGMADCPKMLPPTETPAPTPAPHNH